MKVKSYLRHMDNSDKREIGMKTYNRDGYTVK